jgi:hypothetical protein
MAFSFTPGADLAEITLNGSIPLQAGLDQRYRVNEMPGSRPVALRGSWAAPDKITIHNITLGEFLERTAAVQFAGDEIILTIEDKNFGEEPVRLLGKTE